MTDQQVKRFKYWEFRTMAMCIFGYALFYFVRKNLSIAMPYLNEEMGISKSDRKSTRLNSSHIPLSRMPSSA